MLLLRLRGLLEYGWELTAMPAALAASMSQLLLGAREW